MRLVRQGNTQDLESQIKPDENVKESELTVIEREANKKKRKRAKAQLNGEMISPLATSRPTAVDNARRPGARENPFDLGDDEDDQNDPEQQQAIRDQLNVDQMVDNEFAANAN